MKQKRNRYRKLILLLLAIILLPLFLVWGNNDIVITHLTYESKKVPKEFDYYTIVQISDLHNKEFSNNQLQLVKKLKKTKPDIIVVTGDLIDGKRTNRRIAMEFIHQAVEIAPVYYVSGNHEVWSGEYEKLTKELKLSGVVLMDDSSVELKKDNAVIELLGLADPDFMLIDYIEDNRFNQFNNKLKLLLKNKDDPGEDHSQTLKILLSHRPEYFECYAKNQIDLVFTGHAHGGQFRIPYLLGFYAPGQGALPKYTSGIYHKSNTSMVVSRGLGNSVFPIRLFNRPEIVVVTLKAE